MWFFLLISDFHFHYRNIITRKGVQERGRKDILLTWSLVTFKIWWKTWELLEAAFQVRRSPAVKSGPTAPPGHALLSTVEASLTPGALAEAQFATQTSESESAAAGPDCGDLPSPQGARWEAEAWSLGLRTPLLAPVFKRLFKTPSWS